MSDMAACAAFIRDRVSEWEQHAREAGAARDRDIARGAFLPGREPQVPDMAVDWTDDIAGGAAVVMGAEAVLAQVERLRAIVDLAQESDECGPVMAEVLRHLAAIWPSHPEYDPAWAPDA